MDQTSWNLQKETQRKQEKLNGIKLWNVTEWSSSHWSEHKLNLEAGGIGFF